MEPIAFKGKKTGRTLYRVALTEAEFHGAQDSYLGFCVNCGDTADCCEPDARKYRCESCEQPAVYGIHELLMMGYVELTEEALS